MAADRSTNRPFGHVEKLILYGVSTIKGMAPQGLLGHCDYSVGRIGRVDVSNEIFLMCRESCEDCCARNHP